MERFLASVGALFVMSSANAELSFKTPQHFGFSADRINSESFFQGLKAKLSASNASAIPTQTNLSPTVSKTIEREIKLTKRQFGREKKSSSKTAKEPRLSAVEEALQLQQQNVSFFEKQQKKSIPKNRVAKTEQTLKTLEGLKAAGANKKPESELLANLSGNESLMQELLGKSQPSEDKSTDSQIRDDKNESGEIFLHKGSFELRSLEARSDTGLHSSVQEVFQYGAYDQGHGARTVKEGDLTVEVPIPDHTYQLRTFWFFTNARYYQTVYPYGMGSFDRAVRIPMVEKKSLQRLLQASDQGVSNPSRLTLGSIIVDLSEGVSEVELDRPYVGKLFFDRDWALVNNEQSAQYVLFAYVSTGNVALSTKIQGKRLRRGIFIGEDEVLFLETNWDRPMSDSVYKLSLQSLLSTHFSPLRAQSSLVSLVSNRKLQEVALGSYASDPFPFYWGQRQKMALAEDKTFWFSADAGANIIVPNEAVEEEVYRAYGIRELRGECLVQVNLPDEQQAIAVSAGLRNGVNPPTPELLFFDKSGEFLQQGPVGGTRSIFLKSYARPTARNNQAQSGLMHIHIQTARRGHYYFETHCLPDHFVVEQL